MNNEDVKKITDLNCRMAHLLGIVTTLLIDCRSRTSKSEHHKIDWAMDAINAVIYENKPIPPLPGRDLL